MMNRNMNILHRLSRVPFVRNLGGAMAGGIIALTLYGVYHVASPLIGSLLPAPQVASVDREEAERMEKMQNVVDRAKEILAR